MAGLEEALAERARRQQSAPPDAMSAALAERARRQRTPDRFSQLLNAAVDKQMSDPDVVAGEYTRDEVAAQFSGPDVKLWDDEAQVWLGPQNETSPHNGDTLTVGPTRMEQLSMNVGEGINRVVEGATFGLAGDEANAGLDALIGRGEGDSFGERYDDRLQHWRNQEATFRAQNPKTAAGLEIGGAIASTVATGGTGLLTKGGVSAARSAPTIARAAGLGATAGGTQGFMEGEGTADRVTDGVVGGTLGALFGTAAHGAINIGSAAFRRLFNKTAERPTIEGLAATKRAAYNAVDSSGERFTAAETNNMLQRVTRELEDMNYVPEVDRQTFAGLRALQSASTRDMTISQLDKLRQGVSKRFRAAPNETGLMRIIDGIDDLILSRSSTSEMMTAARLAHSRFKKAEALEQAFQRADDQAAATGSGGNSLNLMRQAVVRIVNDPNKARWYSDGEQALMRQFARGTVSQNVMRQIGKLSPNGNGLMMALNLMAVSVNPSMIAATGAATGAKAIADTSTRRAANQLMETVSTGVMPAARQSAPSFVAPAASSTGNRLLGMGGEQ